MTPQYTFMVAAPVVPGRESALRETLTSMNLRPGVADPHNLLVPFAAFPLLHVARFVILDDATLVDRPPSDPLRAAPVWLVFLGDCDGPPETLLRAFAAQAAEGLTPHL